MKTLLSAVVAIMLVTSTFCVSSMFYYLEPLEQICMHEYFSDKTLVIFEGHMNVTNAVLKISDAEEKVLVEKERNPEFKEAFTTFQGGYYEFCLTNKDRENIAETHFTLKHGVAAKDYSAVAKAKDLKPLELDLLKLDDKSRELNHYIAFSAAHEQIFEGVLDGLTSKISFFSFTIIAVMIVVGLLETFYLRRYFMNRKNI